MDDPIRRRFVRAHSICSIVLCSVLAGPAVAQLQALDFVPPPTPPNLHVTGSTSSSVTLCWDDVVDTGGSGLKRYVLMRGPYQVGLGTANCATDARWPKPDTLYTYRVKAEDNAGNESPLSAPVPGSTLPQASIDPLYDVTIVLLRFADHPVEPYPPAQATDVVFTAADSVNAWLQEVSYGQSQIAGNTWGWYTLPGAGSDYCTNEMNGQWFDCDTNAIEADATGLLPIAGQVDIATDDATIYVVNGLGTWGLSGIFISAVNGLKNFVIAHEFLHTLWIPGHAGSMDCDDLHTPKNLLNVVGSTCTLNQYGDAHDVMGALFHHPSVRHKLRMGVLDDTAVQVVDSDGIYQVFALEIGRPGIKQLEIPIGTVGAYVVEYRTPSGFDADPPAIDGVLVRYAPNVPAAAYIDTLIPMVGPNPMDDQLVLNPGTDFHDTYRDIHVSVFLKTGDSVYVQVDLPEDITIMAPSPVPGLGGVGVGVLAVALCLLSGRVLSTGRSVLLCVLGRGTRPARGAPGRGVRQPTPSAASSTA